MAFGYRLGRVAAKSSGDKAANQKIVLFDPDGEHRAARYDKLHMFDVDLPGGESWKESKIYEAGSRSRAWLIHAFGKASA